MATAIRGSADELLDDFAEQGIEHQVLKRVRAVIETRATHPLHCTERA